MNHPVIASLLHGDAVLAEADAAIGAGPGQAVVSAGGEAFFVDLTAKQVTRIAAGLGKVHGHDRAEDATIYLATDAGLLARDKAGAVSLRTLAPAGQSAVPVLGVAASFGAVMVTTAASLVQINPTGATTVGELAGASGALAVDANGDVWATASGKLTRFATGAKVSFATDVKPFFAKHCSSCHDAGQNGAPKDNFLDYATGAVGAPTSREALDAFLARYATLIYMGNGQYRQQMAAAQICANSSAFSAAPPTRPPSTLGRANNSAAFDALTLPP